MNAQAVVLPICTVQSDFQDIVKDVLKGVVPHDEFWVSCYKFGEPSVHGKASVKLDEHKRDLVQFVGQDGIVFDDHAKVRLIAQQFM